MTLSDILDQDVLPCYDCYRQSLILQSVSMHSNLYGKLIRCNRGEECMQVMHHDVMVHFHKLYDSLNQGQRKIYKYYFHRHFNQESTCLDALTFCLCPHCALQFYIDSKLDKHIDCGLNLIKSKSYLGINCSSNCLIFRKCMEDKWRFGNLLQFWSFAVCTGSVFHDRSDRKPKEFKLALYSIYKLLRYGDDGWVFNDNQATRAIEKVLIFLNDAVNGRRNALYKCLERNQEYKTEFAVSCYLFIARYMIHKTVRRCILRADRKEIKLRSASLTMQKLKYYMNEAEHLFGIKKLNQMSVLFKCDKIKRCGNPRCNEINGENMKICGGCQLIYFCSRKCQKICWNRFNHKYHCMKVRK